MIHIRPIQEQNFSKLSQIYTTAYNTLNIGEQWDPVSAEKLLRHLYKDQPDLFFVAEENGDIVGAITALVKPWWDGNHLTDGELF